MNERIQKVLANLGIASRREIERMISAGRIRLNGALAQLGDRVSEEDNILVDDKPVRLANKKPMTTKVLMYHKPEGQVCTRSDEEGRDTVFQHLPRLKGERWIMVGRLDINTSGLLLFTNNGELAHRLMHPSFEIEREYAVRILGEVTPRIIKQLKTGVELEDGFAHFESIKEAGGTGANRWYHVVLKEGRNREVRRLFESQGLKVSRLMRTRFGNIALPRSLKRGSYEFISESLVTQAFSGAASS